MLNIYTAFAALFFAASTQSAQANLDDDCKTITEGLKRFTAAVLNGTDADLSEMTEAAHRLAQTRNQYDGSERKLAIDALEAVLSITDPKEAERWCNYYGYTRRYQ